MLARIGGYFANCHLFKAGANQPTESCTWQGARPRTSCPDALHKHVRGLSLYSFRHGAADALRRAGHLDEQFGFILGHTGGTMTGRYGIMPQGMLQQRVELVNAIAYPKLEIDHLI